MERHMDLGRVQRTGAYLCDHRQMRVLLQCPVSQLRLRPPHLVHLSHNANFSTHADTDTDADTRTHARARARDGGRGGKREWEKEGDSARAREREREGEGDRETHKTAPVAEWREGRV